MNGGILRFLRALRPSGSLPIHLAARLPTSNRRSMSRITHCGIRLRLIRKTIRSNVLFIWLPGPRSLRYAVLATVSLPCNPIRSSPK